MGRGQRTDQSASSVAMRGEDVRARLGRRSEGQPQWLDSARVMPDEVAYERACRVTAGYADELDWLAPGGAMHTLRSSPVFRLPLMISRDLLARVQVQAVHACLNCDSAEPCDGTPPSRWLVTSENCELNDEDWQRKLTLPADSLSAAAALMRSVADALVDDNWGPDPAENITPERKAIWGRTRSGRSTPG